MLSHEHPSGLLTSPQTKWIQPQAFRADASGIQLMDHFAHGPTVQEPVDNADRSLIHSRRQSARLRSDESGTLCRHYSLDPLESEASSCSHSVDDDTKSRLAHTSMSTEEESHHLLSFLPSLSFVPPSLHRYTGTTTESLLVGVTCCIINIALYITSGILTRVLQQQEHVAAQQATHLDQSSPCPPELGKKGSTSCNVPAPDVVIEHLRVPYMMVWLPQACHVLFLFLALASIKRKYDPHMLAKRGDLSSESMGGPTGRHREGEREETRSLQGRAEPDVEAVMPPKTETGRLLSEADEEQRLPRKARSLSSFPVVKSGELSCTQIRRSLSGEPGAVTAEQDGEGSFPSGPCTRAGWSDTFIGTCWRVLKERYDCYIYKPHLKVYHTSVHAFLKEEMKYENLGKLVLACFLVVCLYLLQGWFWSIAVGTSGMSICSVTAIYSTNSLFVFLFTSLIYKEGADDFIQIIALILATVGVALIAYESQGEPQSTTGVILSVCSSATYGLFEVLYKKYLLQNRSNHPLTFVFFVSGLMGALALVLLWVPIPVLHAVGWETFPSSPPPFLALFLLALSCICSSIYIILLQVSLLLLPSPMLVAMCFLLSLPPAAASDALRGAGGGVGSSGCAFIAFSLVITGIKEWNIKEREEQQGPDFGDLCVPFVFGAEPRLSSDLTPRTRQPTR